MEQHRKLPWASCSSEFSGKTSIVLERVALTLAPQNLLQCGRFLLTGGAKVRGLEVLDVSHSQLWSGVAEHKRETKHNVFV